MDPLVFFAALILGTVVGIFSIAFVDRRSLARLPARVVSNNVHRYPLLATLATLAFLVPLGERPSFIHAAGVAWLRTATVWLFFKMAFLDITRAIVALHPTLDSPFLRELPGATRPRPVAVA